MLVSASNVNFGYRDCSHAKLLLLVHEKAACTLQVDTAGQHRGTVQHLQRPRDLLRSIASPFQSQNLPCAARQC